MAEQGAKGASNSTMQTDPRTTHAAGIAELRRILPPAAILDDPAGQERYEVDWRRMFHGRAALVLRPGSTAEVSDILRICNAHRIAVVPQGGNTGLTCGGVPSEAGDEVLLSLERMAKVRGIDTAGFTISVDAGCVLADIQKAAEKVNRFFPLSLGAEGSCQIGGNISTNAGGIQVVRFGMARDLVLGLEVVLPSGEILDTMSELRKDNTGYDLRSLFIGAEGTLGVITGASLKLFPSPTRRVTAYYAVKDPAAAVRLYGELREQTYDGLIAFELIHRPILDLVFHHVPQTRDPLTARYDWYVLLEIVEPPVAEGIFAGCLERCTEQWVEDGLVLDGTVAASEAQRLAFWRIRESMAEAQRREGIGMRHDVSIPISRVAEFIDRAMAAVKAAYPGLRPVAFGHVGDGNIHFNLLQPEGVTDAVFLAETKRLNEVVHDIVMDLQGSISAEHGIGRLRRDEFLKYKPAASVAVMRQFKQVLDPNGIMNPGRVI